MSSIMREDWIEVELGDLGEIITGNTPSKANPIFYSNKDFPFYKPTDLNAGDNVCFSNDGLSEEGLKNSRIAPEGSILVTCIGATIGKTGLIKKSGAFNQQINCIISDINIDSKFLYFQVIGLEFQKKIKENASSTTLPILNKSKFSILGITLAPLPIQRAIVSKIEALFSDLDNGIANFKKAQDQLKIYRQAVLKKAFEGELTKEWREKQTNLPTAEELLKQIKEERQNHYNQQIEDWKKAVKVWEKNGKSEKKPSKPTAMSLDFDLTKSDQELKEIPTNWSYITLDFATYKLGDGLHGTPQYDENGDYWFINGNNLNNGKILIKPETKKVNLSEFKKYKKDLNEDTILVSINGTIGNVSFYNDEKVILGKSACYFNLLSSFDKNYIRWLIDSFGFMQYAERNATGSTIKNVPLSAMRNFVFPLCSTQEQTQVIQEIESRLSVCDKVEQSISESIIKAEALRQSILKKAFEGKLLSKAEIERCKKEADYEPASELLKKIQAEKLATLRQAQDAKKKKPIDKKKSKK